MSRRGRAGAPRLPAIDGPLIYEAAARSIILLAKRSSD